MTQAEMKARVMDMRRKERDCKRIVAHVRQMIEDDNVPSPVLADAIKLSPAVLALPCNYTRLNDLYSDFIAQVGPLGDD